MNEMEVGSNFVCEKVVFKLFAVLNSITQSANFACNNRHAFTASSQGDRKVVMLYETTRLDER